MNTQIGKTHNRNQKIPCYGSRGVNSSKLPFSTKDSEADPRDCWQAQWELDENCQFIRRRCHQRSEQRRRTFVSYRAYRFNGSLFIFVHNHVSRRFQTTNISADIVSLQAWTSFIIIDTGIKTHFLFFAARSVKFGSFNRWNAPLAPKNIVDDE